jgi:hypothetical protein
LVFGTTEYETPVCPHWPYAKPEMVSGMFGIPVATPLLRCALILLQLPSAVTLTNDPVGIVGPKVMLAVLELPVTTEPAGPIQL